MLGHSGCINYQVKCIFVLRCTNTIKYVISATDVRVQRGMKVMAQLCLLLVCLLSGSQTRFPAGPQVEGLQFFESASFNSLYTWCCVLDREGG